MASTRFMQQSHVAVHILVEQIAKRSWPTRVASLRAEVPQPHVVTCLDLHPILIEPLNGLALKDVKPVFHHMRFSKGNDCPRLKRHDCHMHVVPQIARVDKPRRCACPVRIGHAAGLHVILMRYDHIRRVQPRDITVGFSNPVKRHRMIRAVTKTPARCRRDVGIYACLHVAGGPVDGQGATTFDKEQNRLDVLFRLGAITAAAKAQNDRCCAALERLLWNGRTVRANAS